MTNLTLRARLALTLVFAVVLLAWAAPAAAQGNAAELASYLAKVTPGEIVPGADRFGPIGESPVVAPAYRGDELLGNVFLNSQFVDATGYSGKPIHVLVGLDPQGKIVGARLVAHSEPIVLIGIPEVKVVNYLKSFIGYNPLQASTSNEKPPQPDIVSGATVTVLVIGDSVVRSAVRVGRALAAGGGAAASAAPARVVDDKAGTVSDWAALLASGAVRHLRLTVGEVNKAFAASGNAEAAKRPEPGADDATFIDLYVALVSQPAIGRSLLGDAEFESVAKMLAPGQHAVLVAGDGAYSFKGSGYVRGGIFDRIELIQGAETIRFRDKQHRRAGTLRAAGAPSLKEVDVFAIPPGVEFDPAAPWRLQLLVQRATGALDKAFVTFELPYRLPEQYTKVEAPKAQPVQSAPAAPVAAPAAPVPPVVPSAAAAAGEAAPTMIPGDEVKHESGPPLWERLWRSKVASIAMLAAMLGALTLIFFFQDLLVTREKLFDRIRLGYLVVTLLWLGWFAHAQLSVVNILTFANSLRTGFNWSLFLVDPLIFILWCSVAAALLFWGRGPFCGWLCPFGALQELTNRIAKKLHVPQVKIPWRVHERLVPFKYIIFLGLFGVSLGSLALAEQLSEIEPFKTAIILHFVREWWFVAFAAALLAAGLFIERFFCRYLCPLGAGLAIPGRMRMFDWLKRYRECGNPCQRCARECPVDAIHPEGHINPNECISCLHCQVLYHHDYKCPVRVQRRLKREKRAAMAPSAGTTHKPVIPISPVGPA
ncbi:MAG TPA: 4Fe-4S binding protein [Burkholderiaceae bacterium]|nr:4Fe-4S binding protein [Burkholderiaceae bacterium]